MSDYWKKRLIEESKVKQKQEVILEKEIARLYYYYFSEIEKDINGFINKYAVNEKIPISEVKRRVSEMDVRNFSDKAKRYVREKDFSKKANAELAVYNLKMKVSRLELLQYQMDLNMIALFDEEYKLGEKFLKNEIVSELKTQSGILAHTLHNPKDIRLDVKALLNVPFLGALWSDRIWKRQDEVRKVVSKAVERLLFSGKNPTSFISEVKRLFDVSKFQAKRLLVTEGARLQTEVQKESLKQNGFNAFVVVPESRACDICKSVASSSQFFLVDDFRVGLNAPPFHPHCHCAISAYFVKDAVDKRAEKGYNIVKDAFYGAWTDKNDPNEKYRRRHAELYYQSVLNRDMNKEIFMISKNTSFSKSDIEAIYHHIFVNKHELEDGFRNFDPDYDMAESWRRLREGKDIQPHDLILLKHELYELKLMQNGLSYAEAHEITNQKYNYQKALVVWKIKKGDL